MAYDYREAMDNDIKHFIDENVEINGDEYYYNNKTFYDGGTLYETVYDDMWIDDSVTGNASGSYTFDRNKAKKYVMDNIDLIGDMIREFDIDVKTIGEKFINEDWEYFDVSIRCYLLSEILGGVFNEMGIDY